MKPLLYLINNIRIKCYRKIWSKNVTIEGQPVLNQPLMINGIGNIVFGENVNMAIEIHNISKHVYIF